MTVKRDPVTGAAGQIGYALLFRIASGHLLGPDVPVTLQPAGDHLRRSKAAEGTAMELDDCAFPLLKGIDITDDPNVRVQRRQRRAAGRRPPPHGKGMERGDLLSANGGIFRPAGPGDQRPRGRRRRAFSWWATPPTPTR